MRALGRLFDIGTGIAPIADLAAGANTGKRLFMRDFETVTFLFSKGLASAGTDDIVLTLQEHNASSAGTSQNLSALTHYYYKREATLDNDETWTEVTQAAGATITLAGATYAALQAIVAFSVEATQLSDGFKYLSVNIADPGAGGTIPGELLYIAHGLKIQRDPANMAAMLA